MIFKKIVISLLPESVEKRLRKQLKLRRQIKAYNPDQYLNPQFQSSIAAFHYYRCIFVHIPKNAGISVSYALFGNTGGSHRKIRDYQKIFSRRKFKTFYKFTFVRNPWDRLVSTYFFLKQGGLTEKDKQWAEEHIMQYENFETFVLEWLTEENILNSLHFQPQHIFLEDKDGEFAIDFIGRFENLQEDFKKVTTKLNMERDLKKTNTSTRAKDYQSYYNSATAEKVKKIYDKDIQLFNYTF